jgi:RecB family exonuclease
MRGYIDQVLDLNDRKLIIDFKTSKSPKVSTDYQLQLAVYTLLFEEKFNIKPETYLWFLKFGLKKVPVTDEMIVDAKFKIETVHKALQSSNILDYEKKESGLCKWCNERGSGQCDFYDECFKQKELI